jgi:hypothetical protein
MVSKSFKAPRVLLEFWPDDVLPMRLAGDTHWDCDYRWASYIKELWG